MCDSDINSIINELLKINNIYHKQVVKAISHNFLKKFIKVQKIVIFQLILTFLLFV
jgi:hypothetical protein